MGIQLKEGGYYRRRDGVVFGPVIRHPFKYDDRFPFSANNFSYTENGRWLIETETQCDLIEEVPAPSLMPPSESLQAALKAEIESYNRSQAESPRSDNKDWLGTGYSKAYWRVMIAASAAGSGGSPYDCVWMANALLEELEKTT